MKRDIDVKRVKTWSLTWDRLGTATGPTKAKRTGNHFFSEAKAKEVYALKLAQGRNPSEIKMEERDWIVM